MVDCLALTASSVGSSTSATVGVQCLPYVGHDFVRTELDRPAYEVEDAFEANELAPNPATSTSG